MDDRRVRARSLALAVALVFSFLSGCVMERRAETAPLSPTPVATPATPATPAASPVFLDRAAQAGVNYRWQFQGKRPGTILQTIGHGCAFLDYNRDNHLDILLVGPVPALFQGDGKGRFSDVTMSSGLKRLSGHFLGCAVGDFDNDGWPDIYLSAYRGGTLLYNEGGKSFRDVTGKAGLKAQPWGSSATFADFDNDGRLDLYIGNYVRFGPESKPQHCEAHGYLTACGPVEYPAEYGVFYRNLGGGRFMLANRLWQPDSKVSGKNLGVAAAPLAPGQPLALALANDQMPGDLLLFDGNRPENRGVESGMAFGADGNVYAGMGVDWGDYDNDGQLDLFIAAYRGQPKPIFRQDDGVFLPQNAAALGINAATPLITFGAKWLDFDNDGWLDLLLANGHVQDNADRVEILSVGSSGGKYRQPTLLFRNQEGKRFEDATARLGGEAGQPIVGRGLAAGDYNNDGRMDALIVDDEGKPLLLENIAGDTGNWLRVELEGTKSNRDGYGALVVVEAGGKKRIRHCHADGSYLSASDKRLHFGLGTADRANITVYWPSGLKSTKSAVPANQTLKVKEVFSLP